MAESTPIPGYELLRVLGKGGMATVYLAHQSSVDREVALKLMSKHLLADHRFAERFLREARIAAKLHHRHVVSIFDVGTAAEQPYIAMEYLSGGSVMPHEHERIAPSQALRAVREIALALDYAHGKGFIHRDVKPDNILLRDDGSAVLSDFGIARAVDGATMMTKTGAVVGTPYYMSPEQLRGKEVDGRADLYSLGVVLYQLLTGKVPYSASDSLAIGIMHMTAPLPQLHESVRFIQPLLDRMLAKDVEARIRTGGEIAAAVLQLENTQRNATRREEDRRQTDPVQPLSERRAEAALPPALSHASNDVAPLEKTSGRVEPSIGEIKLGSSTQIRVEPTMRAASQPKSQSNKVSEPKLQENQQFSAIDGSRSARTEADELRNRPKALQPQSGFGAIDPAMSQAVWQKPKRQQEKRAFWPLLIFAAIASIAVIGFVQRDWIQAQWQSFQTGRTDSALAMAQQKEARQDYFGPSGALADYLRLLQQTQTRDAAKAGIERIAARHLDAQATATSTEAQQRWYTELSELERALPGDLRFAVVKGKQPIASSPQRDARSILETAKAAEADKLYLGDKGALANYLALQTIDGNSKAAQLGVQNIERLLSLRFKQLQQQNKVADLEQLILGWRAVNPRSSVLTALNRDWNAARATADEHAAKIAELLQQGKTALEGGDLTSPAGASAIDRYRAVLVLDSKNSAASAGLRAVAIELLRQANTALDRKQLDMAEKLLVQAEAIDPNNSALAALEKRLADALESSSAVGTASPPVDVGNRAELLARFDDAIAAGRLDEPVGQSAFDLLKQLERSGREAPEIAERVQVLSDAFRQQFDESIATSRFERAAEVLVNLRALRVGSIASELRSQLAESVASDIRIRIESGEFDVAQRRLDLLRTINSQHSELESLRLALLQARGT